jgi:5-hydroxyisourate hydrolase
MTKEERNALAESSLTTHVLDTMRGIPAAGIKIELWSLDQSKMLKTIETNSDGRTDAPLLASSDMKVGNYELVFYVGDYFGERRFLDRVPVRFVISDAAAKYHVPLLVSPWAYSTYRGS